MSKKWRLLHRTLKLTSPWVTVYADQLRDHTGKELEYWHYDRPDSAVVIVLQGETILLPQPVYRVGVDEVMLDFAGTRIPEDKTPKQAAQTVVVRELGIADEDIVSLEPILTEPLAVDSSFSSQKLHGFVARIRPATSLTEGVRAYPIAKAQQLRRELRCGQCRLLLDEFLLG